MATYVPNVAQYLPELKTFTPDYKFLSNVLTAKQTKYDTNYKQLNNAYSRIMYSDLSRQDTQEARDQFVNDLQPTLEKISGLDLSLAQNVRAANAVFEPFYDNDLVMKDMVYTKNYKDNLSYAESLMYSNDQETKDKYWKEGIEYMAIKMEDFKNASQEVAMNMGLEQYVEHPQLYKKARAYLDEKGYKIEYDELSKDRDFIITNTNGEDVTATIMADLKQMFSKDQLINKAYYTQSYVDSRNYAKNQMNEGLVGSVQEGINKYNMGNIEAYKKSQEASVEKYDARINSLNDELNTIQQNLKGKAPVPGSLDDMYIKKIQNQIEGDNKEKEMLMQSITLANEVLSSGDSKMINDRGYSIQMNTNIMQDLRTAATNYSMLTAKKKIEVNQAELHAKNRRHAARMQREKFIFEERMKEKQSQLDAQKELAVYEGKLDIEKERGIKRTTFKYDDDKTLIDKAYDFLGLGETGSTTLLTKTGIEDLSEKVRNDTELEFIENAQEKLVSEELGLYTSLYSITDNDSPVNGMVKIPDGYIVPEEYEENITEYKDNIYMKSEAFKELVKENKNAYEAYSGHLYDMLSNEDTPENPDKKTSNSLKHNSNNNASFEAIINLQEKKKNIEDQRNKYFSTAKEQMRVASELSGNKYLPSPIQEDQNGTDQLLSQEQFNKTIESSDAYAPRYLNSKKFINHVRGGLHLGEAHILKDEIIQNYEKNKKLPDDFILEDKEILVDGKKQYTKRFNPKYFSIRRTTYGNRENQRALSKSMGIMTQAAGGYLMAERYYRMFPVKNEKLYNNISNSYSRQLEELDQIQKGTYLSPKDEKPISGVPYYSFVAQQLDLQDPNALLPTLQIGFKTSDVMNNFQYKDFKESGDVTKIPRSMKNTMFLEKAIQNSLGDYEVYQTKLTSATGRKFDNYKKEDQVDPNMVLNIINNYKTGKLEDDYIIEYTPGNDHEGSSEYRIIAKTDVKANKQHIFGYEYNNFITIKMPNRYDGNEINPLNDETNYILNSLINKKTGTHNRGFADNSSVSVVKDGNSYKFNTDFYQWNRTTGNYDLLTSQQIQSQLPSFETNTRMFNTYKQANDYYEEQVKLLTDWSSNQLRRKEDITRYYSEWLSNFNPPLENSKENYKEFLEMLNKTNYGR